jgi:hypothetical protein
MHDSAAPYLQTSSDELAIDSIPWFTPIVNGEELVSPFA